MTDVKELKKKWMKDPKFAAEYEALAKDSAQSDAVRDEDYLDTSEQD